jgi:hypothetical protein
MDISLGRVLEAARERRATLTPEVAGYVILLAARQLAAERSRVSAHSVLLDETGDVLVERASAANEIDIETVLRGLLGASIGLCASPPPAIVAVAERAPSGDLRALVAELSAALIPINHSAAHRALARLYREARRADGHVTDVSLPPIVDRSSEREPELDIEVEVEPEPATSHALVAANDVATEPASTSDPVPPEVGSLESVALDGVLPDVGAPDPIEPRLFAPELVEREPRVRLELTLTKPRWTEVRSDVQQLLDAFLAETRSTENTLRVLRDMIGLELPARPRAPLEASLDAVPR